MSGIPKDAQVPDEKRKQIYQMIEGTSLAERPPDRLQWDPKDPWGRAKYGAQLFMNFLSWLSRDYGLSPEEVVFLNELHSLNFMNLEDYPLPAAKIDEVREKAYQYYMTNRPRAPRPVK